MESTGFNSANIGIRLHDTVPGTLEQRAQAALKQGFSCVHLALGKVLDPSLLEPEKATPGLGVYVKRALNGLDVAVLGCYLNLAHPDEAVYRRTVLQYTAHLRLARFMDAGVVGTETGNPNAGYTYDPENSHSVEALELFIRRVKPVVEAAEKLGTLLAIEPVCTHIVSDARRARRVLDAVASPNLQIILDPVNLLHPDNLFRREEVIGEAIELLGRDTAVIHLKDYINEGQGGIRSLAAGLGEMDYTAVLRFALQHKPTIQMTLEDTLPDNARAAREHIVRLISELSGNS